MGEIPVIHTISVIHLCFVAAFLGLYLCEVVVEASHARDELHPTAVRIHFLLDIFVEIPLVIGILVSGIILSLQVAPGADLSRAGFQVEGAERLVEGRDGSRRAETPLGGLSIVPFPTGDGGQMLRIPAAAQEDLPGAAPTAGPAALAGI